MSVVEGLVHRLETRDGKQCLVLEGALTETVLDDLVDAAAVAQQIDLSGVEYMSSFGVRAWARFVAKLGARSDLTIELCPPVIVHQINRIEGFMGRVRVGSVLVPYLCAECQRTQLEVLHLDGQDGAQSASLLGPKIGEPRPCECGGQLELDEDATSYLAFLRR